MAAIGVSRDHLGGKEIDDLGQIQVVEHERLPGRGIGLPHPADDVLKVSRALVLARLLLRARHALGGIVHLVERALGIEPEPLEKITAAILHEIGHTVECAILLHPHRQREVAGRSGVAVGLMSQDVPHIGLVRPSGEQVQVIDAGRVRRPAERVAGVELEIIALLGKAAGGLAMEVDADIVVELAIEKDRTTGGQIGLGAPRVLNEPM